MSLQNSLRNVVNTSYFNTEKSL